MKLSAKQIQSLAELLSKQTLEAWKENSVVLFKADEKKVLARMIESIKMDFQRELTLEGEVNKRLDQLEKTNPGEFQRHKMFTMLKQKMAKEGKIIL